ncbi:GNAT family acetyltransferase [Phytophthora cinnamomi]|uniref:GNAT family acetyltransferase n=1 Tax=Phytophthora cinnamomi TaxID=4785 RepID=UPI003559F68E|nr:GNAT family acetyltransferase [Phytophthora cinnamomi]
MVATLLAVVMTPLVTSSSAQEPIISQAQEPYEHSYVAGSQLLTWWGQRGDVQAAITQLGGVQQCPEAVNARVDRDLLVDSALSACRQSAAGYDVRQLLESSTEILAPSQEQTARLCSSEACAAWISLAVDATWLSDCRYRQSQTSVRSLAETLLRIREDLQATTSVAPNGSLFREFVQLNQLVHLWSAREDMLNDVGAPVMEVSRRLENFSLMGSGDSPGLSAAVEPPEGSDRTSNAGGSSSSASSSSTSLNGSGSSGSSSSPKKVGGFPFLSGSDFNSSDTAGFTSSGIGPHASSTATTRELTPAYAYVVGAWVLFNGSYFFLMRRK